MVPEELKVAFEYEGVVCHNKRALGGSVFE
jgi:hypothetical protein